LQPTHQYGDDGSYIVTLTVVDDDGGVGVDTLTVTVTNVAPAVYAGPDQTVEVFNTIPFSGTFSDPGVLDTHTIDWDFGDGTGTTGSLTPTHIYNMVGNYTVTLKVTDKDGGVGTDTMNVEVIQKYAVWGNSNDAKAILWSGSGAKIKGNVNSNGGVTMSGSNNAIDGIVYYVSKLTISGSKDTFIPPQPQKVSPRPMPVSFALADYQPGGKEAVKAQNAGKYHLVNGSFNVSTSGTVLDGLYYVKGNVALSGSSIKGTFTVVAEGTISISGSAMNSIAYSGGLLLFANGSSLAISGSNSTLGGIIYVPKGQIAISGSGNKINGGLFGDKITLSGSNMVITAN
jgi:PKD repeat protein